MGVISFVKYIASLAQNAGAIPVDTVVATHERDSDGASVQDVYLSVSETDSGNTTVSPLLANAIYTGTGKAVTDFVEAIVSVYSDVASAADGVDLQVSSDGVSWYSMDTYEYHDIGVLKQWKAQLPLDYYRVRYTNGASNQTVFLLNTKLQRVGGVSRSHAINSEVDGHDDSDLVKAVLVAERAGNPDVFTNINADVSGNLMTTIGGITQDAGGRVRISQLTTLGDYKILNADRPLLIETQGTGTGTFQANKYNMAVTAGQWMVRQSRRYHPYFSGKSQMVECTFDNFGLQANVVKRVGAFSSNAVSPFDATYDGIWLENTGTSYVLKAARAGTQTVSVDWTQWDNYSLVQNYNFDNFTVILFDYLWLGGAVYRIWLKNGGGFILLHTVHYAGTAQDVFIQSPNQPVRYEIRSTTGVGAFRYICSQVSTEGSTNESGQGRTIQGGVVTIATVGKTYPLLAIRKATAFRDISVMMEDLSIFVTTTQDQLEWSIQINPTLSAPLTYAAVPNSGAESASGNGTITVTAAGTIIAAGTTSSDLIQPSNILKLNFLSFLGSTLANVMDEYVLCAKPITANITTHNTISFKEI